MTRTIGLCTLVAAHLAISGCARSAILGSAYTARSTVVPRGAAAAREASTEWTAHVITANGRARMTIVGGALPGLFEKGDYLLIDSVDFIVVKPASKTFFARQNSTGSAAMDSLLPGSMRIVVRDIIARLDTAGTDSIAGFASQHFRMSVSYAIAVDISRAMPSGIDVPPTPMLTTITTDYWYADVPGIQAGVPGTVTRARSGSMGPMRDVTDAIAEASRGLPRAKSLVRVKTATQWTGNGTSGGSESIFGIADFRRLQVDQVQMRLPDDFRETAFPGTTLLSGHQRTPTDGGARWRR